MSELAYKGYSARVELDTDDMLLVGRLAGINDIISFHATTMDDLITAFHETVDDYIESCAKVGKKPEKAYSGKLMLRVDPALHARLARAAELSGQSLNQLGEEALSQAMSVREASRRLAALGGSEPDIAVVQR